MWHTGQKRVPGILGSFYIISLEVYLILRVGVMAGEGEIVRGWVFCCARAAEDVGERFEA